MRNFFLVFFIVCFSFSMTSYSADHLSPASGFSETSFDFTFEKFNSYMQYIREQFVGGKITDRKDIKTLTPETDDLHAYILDRPDLSTALTQSVSIIWKKDFDPVWQQFVPVIGSYPEIMNKMYDFGNKFWGNYITCFHDVFCFAKNWNNESRPFNLALIPHIALENSFQHNRGGKCLCVFGVKEGKFFFSVITPSSYSISDALSAKGERGFHSKEGRGLSVVIPRVIREFNRKFKNLSFDVVLSSRNQSYSFKEKQMKEDSNGKGSILTFWVETREKTGFFARIRSLLNNRGNKLVRTSL